MTITVNKLTPAFAAEIGGIDITRAVDDQTWAKIRAAFDEHSVLVFHGAALDDEQQIAFSRRFGALEVTKSINPAAGTPFARQSNLDITTGDVIPPGDRRMVYQLANMLWHSDSSFKPVPSLCSLLSARIVPPEGGNTNPFNSQKALFLGAHASYIEGLPVEEGRALLQELLAHVGQPQFVYSHAWKDGDLVVWDNRCVLHRATPYDSQRYQRLMQRTTVSGDPAEVAHVPGGRYV